MKISKLLAAMLAAAMAVVALGAFTGCNANDANEKVIRESITEEFDAYKNHDASVVNQIRTQNAVDLATLGIDGEEYANALLDGFDYTIDDVTVDGKEATVTLTLTQKDLDEDEAAAIVEELADDPAVTDMSYDELKQAVSDRIFEYIASVPAAAQDPVTIHLELNGDTWELTPESEQRMETLFTF